MNSFRRLALGIAFFCTISLPGKTRADETPPRDLAEKHQFISVGPQVRAHLLSPASISPRHPVDLIIYALPNGSTIEETLGKAVPPGDPSRFNRQHVAAQTRFLRARQRDRQIVLACVEASGLAWPAWRKRHGNAQIRAMVETLAARYQPAPVRVTLSGHSGGGSFIFGYLESVAAIPDQIERIAFLDATYAYEPDRHAAKLAGWLRTSRNHRLCVLAYRDDLARYHGKRFVSATGGTGFRSKLMQTSLAQFFRFSQRRRGDITSTSALGGRVQILIHQNPEAVILHTVQVERNGFIHSMVTDTRHENRGYTYLGERAYEPWISGHADAPTAAGL